MFRSFCTTKAISSGVVADGSELFDYNDGSGNATLEASDRASALIFLHSFNFAAVVPSCQEWTWILMSLVTSCHDRSCFWGKALLDLIGRFRVLGVLKTVKMLLSRKLVNLFVFHFKMEVHCSV